MSNNPPRLAAALTWLDRPSTYKALAWLLPLLFGLYSLRLGQDANWDLLNYHRYNPFAVLNGKLGLDLAPGQWQSYFNPTLDLLYHGLTLALPAPLTGFLMGALHGLNMVLVLAIARHLAAGASRPLRVAILLTLAACMGPSFRLQVGNTMGDNTTALLVLSAFYLLLVRGEALERDARALLGAGLLAGLATGLKLTNAMYALALCLALFALALPWTRRLRCAFLFGVAVLGGMALTGGWWYWTMWSTFGNPLFPQFNNIFQAPLAAPIGIGDTAWLPRNWRERLLWPFIFTFDPTRVIELKIRQLIWPVLYLLYGALMLKLVLRRPAGRLDERSRFTLLFIALAYLIWLNLFSIYRYLVPVELLAPLAIWLLLRRLLPRHGNRMAVIVLGLCVLAATRSRDWGHEDWARDSFRIELPDVPAPARSMVFTVTADPPLGWIVPSFPADLAFVSVGAGFPESDAYHARVAAMVAARRRFYLMLPATDGADAAAQRGRLIEHGAGQLARYGLAPEEASCRRHTAYLGAKARYFDWCEVTR